MAEALGLTASVIAVTTLAWESSKKLYDLVDGLSNAPRAISHTKANLSATQTVLESLRLSLTSCTDRSAAFDSLLQGFRLAEALRGSQEECDRFGRKIHTYTKHATFSKRDRFALTFHEAEINQFNGRLREHRQVIILVTTSMNLIISNSSSTDVQQLCERFMRQETELNALNMQLTQQLSDLSLSNRVDENATAAADDHDRNIDSMSRLQSICKDSISATSEGKAIKQSFGDVSADNSRYYEGIAGTAQGNVTQTHGKAVVTGGSTAARGQMDADTFKIMFGGR